MATPQLPAVADLAHSLGQEVAAAGSAAVFQVVGPRLSGKSSLLTVLGDDLAADGRIVLRAGPPAGANDAGPLAVMQLAAGLKAAGAINGDGSVLRDREVRLEDKLDRLRTWIERAQVVLLLDEPMKWGSRSDTTGHFAERAELVADMLLRGVAVPRVFTGAAPSGLRANRHRVPDPSGGQSFLLDVTGWGPLAATAAAIAEDPTVDTMTPLDLRLLVAAHAVDAERAVATDLSRRDRADALFEHLATAGPRALADAWRRLATLRGRFDDELLQKLTTDLDERSLTILRHCLLLSSPDGWRMHENLREDARRHRGAHDAPADVEPLAEHYAALTDELDEADRPEALVTVMEATYYGATAGLRELVEQRGCYVEQLDLLGKALSLEHRDFAGAVEVFGCALALDPEDDYAAHYLGFNLDRLGRDAARAERHYQLAVELDDRHPWWRSRLISFLAERGQVERARREWDDALDSLIPPEGTSDLRLFEPLHGWVAATLLRIGELRFARSVLDAVPSTVMDRSAMLSDLTERLRAFEIADSDGAYVPASLLRDGWWKVPAQLQGHVGEERLLLLRRWLAGRVVALEDGHVELRVADIAGGETRPRFARTRITVAEFDRWSRDDSAADLTPGRFVEIGLYSAEDGSEARRLLRVHPEVPVESEVPGTIGPLDRWHPELAGIRS